MIDVAASPSLLPRTRAELTSTLATVVACNAVGAVGAVTGSAGIREWLPTLDQPKWQPPGRLFGPVWTVLYTLMGLSITATRRVSGDEAAKDRATRLFAVQLAVNALWSYLFFTRRNARAALVDAGLIVLAVAATIKAIYTIHKPAALLLLPYLAWVSFAFVLNADLVRRNPGR